MVFFERLFSWKSFTRLSYNAYEEYNLIQTKFTKYKDDISSYENKLSSSEKQLGYINENLKKLEAEIVQKNGKLFVTSKLKISDFKTK